MNLIVKLRMIELVPDGTLSPESIHFTAIKNVDGSLIDCERADACKARGAKSSDAITEDIEYDDCIPVDDIHTVVSRNSHLPVNYCYFLKRHSTAFIKLSSCRWMEAA